MWRGFTDLLKTLADRMEIRADKEGLLSISIEDKDPKRAAAMVQFALDELSRVNMELQTTYNQYLARVLDPKLQPLVLTPLLEAKADVNLRDWFGQVTNAEL